MNKRMMKCLRRIAERKSIPDFGAWCDLEAEGYIKVSGPSDDIETVITDAGQKILYESDRELPK